MVVIVAFSEVIELKCSSMHRQTKAELGFFFFLSSLHKLR